MRRMPRILRFILVPIAVLTILASSAISANAQSSATVNVTVSAGKSSTPTKIKGVVHLFSANW